MHDFSFHFITGKHQTPPENLLAPNWVTSVEPCSYGTFITEQDTFKIERKESGPVTINGFPISEEQHNAVLAGEEVTLVYGDDLSSIKLESPGVLTMNGKELPGSKGVGNSFGLTGIPSEPIDPHC